MCSKSQAYYQDVEGRIPMTFEAVKARAQPYENGMVRLSSAQDRDWLIARVNALEGAARVVLETRERLCHPHEYETKMDALRKLVPQRRLPERVCPDCGAPVMKGVRSGYLIYQCTSNLGHWDDWEDATPTVRSFR